MGVVDQKQAKKAGNRPSRPVRLLAVDVDGTILDPSGQLDPIVHDALRQAMEAGIRVVLCTGRRFRRASAIAAKIGLETPMVCNSGALVKCPGTNATYWRAEHSPEEVERIMRVFDDFKKPILSFLDTPPEAPDFVTAAEPSGCALFDQYLAENRGLGKIDAGWRLGEKALHGHFHLCAAGSRDEMQLIGQELETREPGHYQIFVQKSPNYVAWMCEVLRRDANKWTALKSVSSQWGVADSEICAVGDDANDVPMIAAAGWGVAMGHAADFVKEKAAWIAPDNASHGMVDVVRILLESQNG